MFHRWAALVLVLALCAMSPKTAAGQAQSKPRGQSARRGLTNYPNPFNPETSFDFDVGPVEDCSKVGGQQFAVTLRIYNALMQPIATAKLKSTGSTSASTPIPAGMVGQPLANLR